MDLNVKYTPSLNIVETKSGLTKVVLIANLSEKQDPDLLKLTVLDLNKVWSSPNS